MPASSPGTICSLPYFKCLRYLQLSLSSTKSMKPHRPRRCSEWISDVEYDMGNGQRSVSGYPANTTLLPSRTGYGFEDVHFAKGERHFAGHI
jgi:hypothetical protein